MKHNKKPAFNLRKGWVAIPALFFALQCSTTEPATTHSTPDEPVVESNAALLSWKERIASASAIQQNVTSTREDYVEGLRLMSTALNMQPDSLISYTLYADLYLRTGRIRDAILLLEQALERDVDNADSVWSRIAFLYDLGGSTAASIASYEQALEREPDNGNLLNGYINVLIRAKRYDEARYQLSQRNQPKITALLLYKMAESMIDHPDETQWMELVTEAEELMVGADEITLIQAAMMTSNLALQYPGDDETIPNSLYRRAVRILEPLTDSTEYPDTLWSLLFDLYTVLGDDAAADDARRMLALEPSN